MTTDPFDALALPPEPIRPRSAFVRSLRTRLESELGVDPTTGAAPPPPSSIDNNTDLVADLPPRRPVMAATTASELTALGVTPYLAVHDGPAALAFYVRAFGAVETMRVVSDDGRVGHAEITIGRARFFLSDEFPEIGVVSPRTLGGTAVALHLDVADVDRLYSQVIEAGANALSEPADQPHGARHGTLMDPYGHRWMLSQAIETVGVDDYAQRMAGTEWSVEAGTDQEKPNREPATARGGIWAAVNCHDALAVIGYLVDVFGFTEQLVVPGDQPGVVEHSQLQWPEGGIVQVATAGRLDNIFSARPVGSESLYVITADPARVYQRCVEAGAEVVMAPASPDYDPQGMVFTVRDPEGNLWSFGTYTGEA